MLAVVTTTITVDVITGALVGFGIIVGLMVLGIIKWFVGVVF